MKKISPEILIYNATSRKALSLGSHMPEKTRQEYLYASPGLYKPEIHQSFTDPNRRYHTGQ
jgi:hypothetical protein